MGKTSYLSENISDTKGGTFHAKMGSIKDRNLMGLTEAEDIKKWQEYTVGLYEKDLHNPNNHDSVLNDPQSDILECEVKCVLGSITTNKASVGDEILAEPFKSPNDDAFKVLHSIHQQIWKSQQVVT